MTNVYFVMKNNNINLKMKGHADYNPGNDIVCSALSAIVCTYAELLREAAVKEELQIEKLEINSGDVEIEVKDNKSSKVEAYTEFAIKGFEGIQEAFPQNVELNKCAD